MFQFIAASPFLFLASLLWIALAAIIGYLYRHTIPLGYAMLFAFNGSVLAGMRFDDVFMEKPGVVQLFALVMVYIGPVVGFIALRYWYASGTPGIIYRLANPQSISVRPEIRVIVTEDTDVYLDQDAFAHIAADGVAGADADVDVDADIDASESSSGFD